MKRLFISLLISAITIYGIAHFLPEHIMVDSFTTAAITAAVLGLVNAFIRPVVKALTLPINFVSLGLFSLIINALMLMLVDYLVDGFAIYGPFYGFLWALIMGVLISVVTGVIENVVGVGRKISR